MCDACQRRKEEREFVAPLGDVDQPPAPFEVTSMNITGPYVNKTKEQISPHFYRPFYELC